MLFHKLVRETNLSDRSSNIVCLRSKVMTADREEEKRVFA